jgi:hypothetical protein
LRRTFALTGDDHEPLYSENGWTHFTTQKGYTMKLKLMSVFVDDQDKALKFYTDVLGFAKKLDFPIQYLFKHRTPSVWCAPS